MRKLVKYTFQILLPQLTLCYFPMLLLLLLWKIYFIDLLLSLNVIGFYFYLFRKEEVNQTACSVAFLQDLLENFSRYNLILFLFYPISNMPRFNTIYAEMFILYRSFIPSTLNKIYKYHWEKKRKKYIFYQHLFMSISFNSFIFLYFLQIRIFFVFLFLYFCFIFINDILRRIKVCFSLFCNIYVETSFQISYLQRITML